MHDTAYAGIDYGLGLANVDRETGIRFGVINQNDVGEAWYESAEADYGDPTCGICGNAAHNAADAEDGELDDYDGSNGEFYCPICKRCFDPEDAYGDEPLGFSFEDAEYSLSAGSDGDIFVLKSPYYTRAQFCSPCAPGAGYLMNPCETGPRTYCLGPEWFENDKAPYPVYRVSDDTPVSEVQS